MTLIAVFAILALPVFSHAASFNNDSGDCPTVMIAVKGKAVTENDPCWKNQTSVTAQHGETVNVRIYYHNTAYNETARDTRVFLTSPLSSTTTSVNFNGRVQASNAGQVSGNVNVAIMGGGTLSFIDAKWYPNQSQTQATPAYSSSNTIFSSGLELGDIGPDDPYNTNNTWVTQGSVVASFLVEGNQTQTYECNDGYDNDNDGYVDYPNDPGCSSSSDDNEYNSPISDNDNVEVDTGSAYNVDEDSARLEGELRDTGAGDVDLWFEWDTDRSDVEDGDGRMLQLSGDTNSTGDFDKNLSGLNDNTRYYFRACAEDRTGDEDCGSVKSFTTDGEVSPEGDLPEAVTTTATGVSTTSATLGALIFPNGDTTTAWIEWGRTNSLGADTMSRTISSSVDSTPITGFISGLSVDTIYYFRGCSRNSEGTDCGATKSFKTFSNTYVPPTVIYTGGGSGHQHIALNIEPEFDTIYEGDRVEYIVTYENIGGHELFDTVISVELPEDIIFQRTNRGDYNKDKHTVTFIIGDMKKDEDGELVINGDLVRTTEDTLVSTVVIAFTTPSGAQDDAIDYAVHDVVQNQNSSLAGLSLFGGSFFPQTLGGWLLLILVILALVYIGRKLATQDKRPINNNQIR